MIVVVPYIVAAVPARGRLPGLPVRGGTIQVSVDALDPLAAALERVRALHAGTVRFAGHPRPIRLTAAERRRISYGAPYMIVGHRVDQRSYTS